MANRPRSTLTPIQKTFIDAKMLGKTDAAAAKEAGQPCATPLNRSVTVREELAAARRWLTDTTQIKRLDVVEGIIDGIEMARHLGDPASVIRGWVEVGKILGHAQPDTRVTNLTINQMQVRSKFELMPIEELLAISEGRVYEHGA